MRGFDIAGPVYPEAIAQLRAKGYGFVAGYLSYNSRKNLTATECRALTRAGLSIVSVFEAQGDRYTSFDGQHGHSDAIQAMVVASEIGQPLGSCIYFAVDFDATAPVIEGNILPYFRAVNANLAGKYKVGVYGSGLVLGTLRQMLLAEYFWLASAGGWSGTRGYAGPWHIKQSLPSRVMGMSVDPDTAIDGDFGQWTVADISAPPAPKPGDPVAAIPSASEVQRALVSAGYAIEVDGIWGPQSARALRDYYDEHMGDYHAE